MSALSPLSGIKRKSDLRASGRLLTRLCENAIEPTMHRIVFLIAFFRQKLPVQLVSASTKSTRTRWHERHSYRHRNRVR